MRYILPILTASLLVFNASAQELLPSPYQPHDPGHDQAPVIYSKTIIKIVPNPAQVKLLAEKAKAADAKPTAVLPELPRIAKEFTVDVRPPSFLTQQGFISQQPFGDKEGLLIQIDPPAATPLKRANLIAKVDVLFVAENGDITQIAPNLSLRTLEDSIDTGTPLRAFVLLKAGMAQTSDIQPGDHIEGAPFKTHPIMLEETKPPQK